MIRRLAGVAVSWCPALLWALVIFQLSAASDPPGSGWLGRIPAADKLGHLALYGVLGMALAYGRRRQLRGRPAAAWVHAALILLGALYGASDEWHQSFVPGREVSVLDWLADLAGVTLGYSVASVRPSGAADPPGDVQ